MSTHCLRGKVQTICKTLPILFTTSFYSLIPCVLPSPTVTFILASCVIGRSLRGVRSLCLGLCRFLSLWCFSPIHPHCNILLSFKTWSKDPFLCEASFDERIKKKQSTPVLWHAHRTLPPPPILYLIRLHS